MKKALILLLAFWSSMAIGQNIHSLSVTDIDGNNVSLNTYQNKKILICIAPVNNYGGMVSQIDSFQTVYGDSIKLIGVMSYEDGYIDSNKAKIKNLYTTKGINILLTEGMYTKNGGSQSVLMQWLTDKLLNHRFNTDVKGVGQKFFIDKKGGLYAVLPTTILFTSPILNNYTGRQ